MPEWGDGDLPHEGDPDTNQIEDVEEEEESTDPMHLIEKGMEGLPRLSITPPGTEVSAPKIQSAWRIRTPNH